MRSETETLSVNAIAARYGISRVTVYKAIERGELKCKAASISGVVVNQIDAAEAAAWAREFLQTQADRVSRQLRRHKAGLKRAQED